MTIRVIQMGLGPIGSGVARQLLERPGFEVSAAVDIDPEKVGKDLGQVCGLETAAGVVVEKNLAGWEDLTKEGESIREHDHHNREHQLEHGH